jgi:uncharacterized lipoprotein YmbA
MKNRGNVTTRWLVWLLALVLPLSGCLNVKPVVDSTRFFVLSSAAGPTVDVPKANFSVGLARIEIPDYLQSRRMAVRQSHSEIQYSENLQWGERLDKGIQRALGASLASVIGPGNAVLSVWRRGDVRAEIYVSVQRFECDAQGQATLEASWRITSPGAERLLHDGRSKITRPGPPLATDPDGAVAALSKALGDLARELATVLGALPPPPTR